MWKTIAELVMETGLHRTTFLHARKRFAKATRQSGKIWMVDDEHPDYLSWSQEESSRGRPRLSKVVIIKAQGPGPAYAYIRRVGSSMSDLRDIKNHLGLNDEQEARYQQAWQLVADSDIPAAREALEKVFTWVKVEQ